MQVSSQTAENLQNIRNIGFAAHIDAGKTTTTERILFYTKKIHRIGDVDEGTTTTDWMEEERERGITIVSAAVTCYWKDHRINIIDTPGHVDFTAEVERAFRVLDGLIIIFDAVAGVQPQSESVWYQSQRYNIPKLFFINKMDRPGADPLKVLKNVHERLSKKAVLIQLPVFESSKFVGIIDLVNLKRYIWDIDETGENYRMDNLEMDSYISKFYEQLIYHIAEYDEALLEEYLSNGYVNPDMVKKVLREKVIKDGLIPVFLGASAKNKGVQPLLDGIVTYLPSPLDLPAVRGKDPRTGQEIEREQRSNEKFSAIVFKIQFEKETKGIAFARIYSGRVKINEKVLNVNKNVPERIMRIYLMHANRKMPLQMAEAGEIVGLVGLKHVSTGDTLSDAESPIVYPGANFPDPVVSQYIEPKTIKDMEKLEEALRILSLEDPTFYVKKDSETGQLLIHGMGELHLEIITDRIKKVFGVDVKTGKPQVSFRETVTESYCHVEQFDRVLGESREIGYSEICVEPGGSGSGLQIEIKEELIESDVNFINKIVRESLDFGPVLGYPVTNIKIIIKKMGGVGTTAFGNELALRHGIEQAISKAKPVLLEPYVRVEIISPPEFVGEIVGNLSGKGGELESISPLNENVTQITAHASLRSMMGFAVQLRNMTQGRGTFWMKVSHYSPVKEKITDKT